jgi:NAD-dependent dihydropyrimidine dehydrogenase PreA subunit
MVYLRNVTTITLDSAQCNGCARCIDVCARAVLHMADHRAQIVNRDACIECGACQRNCASGAISVQSGVGCAGNQSVPQGQATAMWLLRLDLLRVKGMKTFATLGEYRRSDSEQ